MPTGTPWSEQFNSAIRGGAMSVLTLAFCYMFILGYVSTDAFISIYATVLGWWFATRTNQQPKPTDTPPNGAATGVTTP